MTNKAERRSRQPPSLSAKLAKPRRALAPRTARRPEAWRRLPAIPTAAARAGVGIQFWKPRPLKESVVTTCAGEFRTV